MEAVTDVVFRHVLKQAGAPDVFFTEFANATGWVHAGDKAIAGRLVKTDDEHPLVAQIWGGEPGDMEQFAAIVPGLASTVSTSTWAAPPNPPSNLVAQRSSADPT